MNMYVYVCVWFVIYLIWILGIKFRYSARAASALSH